ncbi:hypothetical protein P7K49_023733 [Saguinus oedipus]|uniref:Uncharacterized protein n=1 Tax=Saguinus oedipus TaxID=9490 RepID=A0ABQ9UMH0_SAGOE|nr:hypothetical protein P7K49_023733 [Saguinus oedipus]
MNQLNPEASDFLLDDLWKVEIKPKPTPALMGPGPVGEQQPHVSLQCGLLSKPFASLQ